MLTAIHPKRPMRDKSVTRDYYIRKLGFTEFGRTDFPGYLMIEKDGVQIPFFEFKDRDPTENYGQVYMRTREIDALYGAILQNQVKLQPNGNLETKP